MTNAIETTKREMYSDLARVGGMISTTHLFKTFEESLDSHLEQLRQQYEQMAATARERFDYIQSLEQANQELQRCNDNQYQLIRTNNSQLSAMTEDRDAIRNKLQAFEFANKSSGEFLIDALRKVKSQRKTIKALRKAQEARESVVATSVSSEGEFGHNMTVESSKQHRGLPAQHLDAMCKQMEASRATLDALKEAK